MRRVALGLGSVMLASSMLASCSGSDEASADRSETATVAATETAEPSRTAPSPESDTPGLIPARFQGVWDHVEGTCDPQSDLRMEIGSGEILFYESVGKVTGVEAQGDDAVVALAMEGEGERWEQRTRLSLGEAGGEDRLLTSDGDAPKVDDEYPSKRCPG